MSDRTNPRRAAALESRKVLRSLLTCRCGLPLTTRDELYLGLCRRCVGRPAKRLTCRPAA